MSDNGTPSPSDTPSARWEANITPLANGEGHLNLVVHAEGVTTQEVAHVMSKLVTMFTSQHSVLPTETQIAAQRAAAALAKEHPAQRIFVRGGQQKWLGESVPPSVVTQLVASGWLDAGQVPDGVVRGCDYAKDPDAFTAALTSDEGEAAKADA